MRIHFTDKTQEIEAKAEAKARRLSRRAARAEKRRTRFVA